VLDAVASAITTRLGLSQSAVKVFTHRRFTLDPEQDELPAVSVDYGEDTKADTSTLGMIDSVLAVQATAVIQDTDEASLRTRLLELRAEIHRAVMSDRRLGLPDFVVSTYYAGASAPAIDPEGEQLVGELTSNWLVHYRMELTDPA
jgi:hypothetical protein